MTILQNVKGKTYITPAICHLSQQKRWVPPGTVTELIIPEKLEPLQRLSQLHVCHCFLPLVQLLKLKKKSKLINQTNVAS